MLWISELEDEANIPQPRRVRLSQPDVRYCIYMMETYGEDYKVETFLESVYPCSSNLFVKYEVIREANQSLLLVCPCICVHVLEPTKFLDYPFPSPPTNIQRWKLEISGSGNFQLCRQGGGELANFWIWKFPFLSS